MLKFTKIIPDFALYNSILNYESEDSIFFDIETTGLSPLNAMVFLIGTIHFDGHNWILTQLLAQNTEDESELLYAFLQLSEQFHTLIHFNGTAFDIPFIKERASNYIAAKTENKFCQTGFQELLQAFSTMNSIDLYQHFRPLKKLLDLPRMNQQTLEQFLAWKRQDQLTGKHMISLFKKYTLSNERLLADLLLLHNHDDLIGMTRLLSLASYQMLSEGFIQEITSQKCSEQILQLDFSLFMPLPVSLQLDYPVPSIENTFVSTESSACKSSVVSEYSITLNITGRHGFLTIPFASGELKYFFPDYKNYYYLPSEDQAIHKSIGTFVDSEYRENAKPATCYVKKQGYFLPQPSKIVEPVFRPCYNSKELYFEYTDDFKNNPDLLMQYVQSILRAIV